MTAPLTNTLLSLILTALGLLGVILSFLVPDRRKSLIALAIGGVVVVVGLGYFTSTAISRSTSDARIRQMQQARQADLDQLRARLRDRATQTTETAPPKKP